MRVQVFDMGLAIAHFADKPVSHHGTPGFMDPLVGTTYHIPATTIAGEP